MTEIDTCKVWMSRVNLKKSLRQGDFGGLTATETSIKESYSHRMCCAHCKFGNKKVEFSELIDSKVDYDMVSL